MFGYDWPQLHALLNDLPAALLVTAVLFDLIGTLGNRPAFRHAGFLTLVVGAVGGVLAVLSGLQAEERISHGSAVHEVMEQHEQFAFITLGVFGVLALWRIFRESKMGSGERWATLLVSLVGVGVLCATGRQGGKLMFEHAAGIPSKVLEAELKQRMPGSHQHPGGEGSGEGHEHADSAGTPPHQHDGTEDHSHPADTSAH